MARILEGTFRAKVLPFTFEKVGEKESPVMKANFQPIGLVLDGQVKVEENLPRQNKAYFLGIDIVTKGKYAGKSQMEALKEQLESSYGYTGAFDMTAINAFMEGKEVDIVCEPRKEKDNAPAKYTDVKYVNQPGSKGARKPVKHLSGDELAAFAKDWDKAGKPSQPPVDAKSLFAQLTGSAEKKPDGQ